TGAPTTRSAGRSTCPRARFRAASRRSAQRPASAGARCWRAGRSSTSSVRERRPRWLRVEVRELRRPCLHRAFTRIARNLAMCALLVNARLGRGSDALICLKGDCVLISEWGSKAEAGDPNRPLGRRANRLPVLSAAIVALGALPAPAQAALTAAGAIDPATKAPAFYQDANGLKLGLCHPGTVNCGPAVPGEDFYYMATSTFTAPNGGTASLILNMTLAPNASGDPASFNRVRVQLHGLPAGTWAVRHPYRTA